MTKDEILAMEPGRELDALVAEKWMGLEVLGTLEVTRSVIACRGYDIPYYQVKGGRTNGHQRPVYLEQCCCAVGEKQPSDDDYWGHYAPCLRVVDDYSADIAAAWRVVEKVTAIPTTVEAAHHAANTRFMILWEKDAVWAMDAEEAAEFICKAALLATLEAE